MARTGNHFKAVALAAFLLSLIGAGCGSGVGGPSASASARPFSSPSPAASPAGTSSGTASSPTARATGDAFSSTPALALPGVSVPIGFAPGMSNWVVGRHLAAPGMGTEIFADGELWVVNRKDAGFTDGLPNGEIYRIDPSSGNTTATVEHARGGFPSVGSGAIWLVNAEFGQTVTRVDLKTLKADRFRTSTTEDPVPEAVVVAQGNVWVGNNHDGTVAVVDPATLTVTRTIRLTEPGGFGVRGKAATDGTSVWFGISRTGEIVRIDAATATEVSRIRLPQVPHAQLPEGFEATDASVPEQLVVVGDRLYASTVNHLYAIDVSTVGSERIVADLTVDDPAATVITSDEHGDLWALVRGPMRLAQIDPATSDVLGVMSLDVGDDVQFDPATGPADLVAGAGSVWIRVPDGVIQVQHQ
jgi:YVTN family beta-propeller protein